MTLIDEFHQRAAELYVPPARPGRVRITVRGNPDLNHVYEMGESLVMRRGEVPAAANDADAEIILSAKMMRHILDTPTRLEPRSPPYVQTIRVSGNMTLIHHLVQMLKRPDAETAALMARVRAHRYPPVTAVEEIDRLDAGAILDAIMDSRPLCVRGALGWKMQGWSLDDLDREFGALPLRSNPLTGRMESFRDIIAAHRSGENERFYTSGCTVPDQILPCFRIPGFADRDFQPARIWFGRTRGSHLVTKLHSDLTISFLGQIWGEKRLRLYSPDQYACFYPIEAYNFYQTCQADPSQPDDARFPRLKEARPADVSIRPGDLLIIPAGWYHCVWAVDDVFSVSRFMEQTVAERLHRDRTAGIRPVPPCAGGQPGS